MTRAPRPRAPASVRLAPAVAVLLGSGLALAGDTHAVSVSAPAAKVGQAAQATVSVSPRGGYHMNTKYPTKLTLTAPEGVTLGKEKVTCADGSCTEQAISLPVSFTAGSAGAKTITGTFKFAVCSDSTCLTKTESVSIAVNAQ